MGAPIILPNHPEARQERQAPRISLVARTILSMRTLNKVISTEWAAVQSGELAAVLADFTLPN
jgi:hypothetical protein